MNGYRNGLRVLVCDGCHEVIGPWEQFSFSAVQVLRGDGEWVQGHVHSQECLRRFRVSALHTKRAEPEPVE